jgi:hypothetical protein
MGLHWEKIPLEIRSKVGQSSVENGGDFPIRELSQFLLRNLGNKSNLFENNHFREMVYNGLYQNYNDKDKILVNCQGLSNILYSFGEMNIEWYDIPKHIRECFYNAIEVNSPHFNSVDISTILYG